MPSLLQDPTCHIPIDPILARLVEAAKTAAHDDAETCKRIHRAAGLVEAGAVQFEDGLCTVKSGNALYPITNECPCPDMVRRDTTCKHLWAKWLAIRLAQEKKMVERPTVWYAWNALTAQRGRAIEDGTGTWFLADGQKEPALCERVHVVLLGDKAMQDAAAVETA